MTSAAIEAAVLRRVGTRVVAPFDVQHGDSEKHTDCGAIAEVNRHAPVALVRFDCGCRAYVPLRRLKRDTRPAPPAVAVARAVVRPEGNPNVGPPPARPAPAPAIDDPGTSRAGVRGTAGLGPTTGGRAPAAAETGSGRHRREDPPRQDARRARPAAEGGMAPPPRRRGHAPMIWTPEKVVEAMRAWAAEHGRSPSAEAWTRVGPGHPCTKTVVTRFGSWRAGLRAAGLEPNRSGPGRRK